MAMDSRFHKVESMLDERAVPLLGLGLLKTVQIVVGPKWSM